jgi:hypothetical protein
VTLSITAVIGFLIFGSLLVHGLFTMGRAADSAGWPEIDGEIFQSRVAVRYVRGKGWYPDIRYTYIIDGQEHIGRRLSFGGLGETIYSKTAWQRAVERYPAEKRLKVHVCLTNASLCTLECGISRANIFQVVFSLVLLGMWVTSVFNGSIS